MLGTEPPTAGKSTAAPFARRRRVPSILDPRYHFAAPSRVEPKDPNAGRTPAATRLRSQSRTLPPEHDADAAAPLPRPIPSSVSLTTTRPFFCARCFGLGRPLGAGALLAGEAPPHRAAPTAEHPATNPAAPCLPLQWITRASIMPHGQTTAQTDP